MTEWPDAARPDDGPATAPPSRARRAPATVLRGVALGLYLFGTAGPGLLTQDRSPIFAAAQLAVGFVLIAATVESRHRVGAGVVLGLASVLAVVSQYAILISLDFFYVSLAFAPAIPALAWAVSRPFRGLGYVAIAGGTLVMWLFGNALSLLPGSAESPPWLAGGIGTVLITVGSVVAAIALERRQSRTAKPAVLA